MKKNFIVLLALFALFSASCSKDPSDVDVRVRFHNATPDAIQVSSMNFGPDKITDVGAIPAGSSSDYRLFDYFETGDGLPMGELTGLINGESFSAWAGLWCGTGVEFKQLEPGNYTVKITKIENSGVACYMLRFE